MGGGEKSFLFCFFKVHGSMLCILNPQKKMELYTAPNLANKKKVAIHPATLQRQEKTCSHPTILQNPKKMMFSHSPLPSKNSFKKRACTHPEPLKKKETCTVIPWKNQKKKTGDGTGKIGAKTYFIPYYFSKYAFVVSLFWFSSPIWPKLAVIHGTRKNHAFGV